DTGEGGLGLLGQAGDVVVVERLQLAAHEVRPLRELAARDACSQPFEQLLVEAVPLEDLVDGQNAKGGQWTPSSVTIAAINAAGVTSKAGLRAGKRLVSSAGSRSSIGIPDPSGVSRSRVDVGATT